MYINVTPSSQYVHRHRHVAHSTEACSAGTARSIHYMHGHELIHTVVNNTVITTVIYGSTVVPARAVKSTKVDFSDNTCRQAYETSVLI